MQHGGIYPVWVTLLPLCGSGPAPSAESQPPMFVGYVTANFDLPCRSIKSWLDTTSSMPISSSPCGTSAVGDKGGGALSLLRVGAGGVGGQCSDHRETMGGRAGLKRQRFLFGPRGCVESVRF